MADREIILNQKPQINISRSTAGRMWLVFCCAGLAVIQSALSDGGASLVLALTVLCCAILAELLITWRKSGFEKVKDGSAAASAMVLSLLLPNYIHPLYGAFGALFAIVVVKHSFGGLGSNWLNPGLGAWLFVRFSWPLAFDKALEGSPLSIISASLRSGVPGLHDAPMNLFRMSAAGANSLDAGLTAFFNNTIFAITGAELPPGYIDLLFLRSPGIIADRGLLALLAGTIIITAFKINRSWIAAVFLALFGFLTWFAGDLLFGGLYRNGDVLFALFSGGTIAAAFILASEPASGAKSKPGALFVVVLGAILSWSFRFQGLEVYGCFCALALVNALTPVIRFFELKLFFSRGRKIEAQEVSV
ncbi:hypothetical protein AGMMS50293_20230 [Spirochaetia bacterium]|nr:hypothetical protein AGMMS50293_20230 [Spirochaetia bacterium]